MDQKKILVSVVMAIYNEPEEWIKTSVESILNQTYRNFELLIINDNPVRELNKNILEHYKEVDHRVICIQNSENMGLTKSLNTALGLVKGDYIARMDSDDYSFPERLEKQVNFLHQNPEMVAVGTWINFFGITNKKNREYRTKPDETRNFLMIYTPIAHPTVMIRGEVFSKFGIRYNENFKYSQDYELFYQLSKIGGLSNIPEILLNYRTANNQISQKNDQYQKTLASDLRKKILGEFIGDALLEEFKIFDPGKRIASFKKVNKYSRKIKKTSKSQYQQLCILKYLLLISPQNLNDRITFLFLLIINPFQNIGYSFRYYIKALLNQLFLTYKPLI